MPGQRDMYTEKRVVFEEERREIDECDKEEFDALRKIAARKRSPL